MDFVTPIVTPIVGSLMVFVKKHLDFLVSSTEYVRQMGTKMKDLNATVDDVKQRIETNNANSRMIPHRIWDWFAQVETIKTEVEMIERGGYGCFNMKMRYRVGKQSYDKKRKIAELIKEESEIKWTNEPILLSKVMSSKNLSTSAPGQENSFESRDQIFKDALKFLEPSNNKTQKIALCGMGGVGKTTMMEQLKKAVEDSKMFNWVVKVIIGQNADPISIQRAISEKIGEAITETTKDARAERLQKRFAGMSENGKNKVLVILDDLWEEIELKDIGLTCPLPNGFKLLLTSRNEKVCTLMGVEKSSILRMEVLREQEAQRFFWEVSGLISNVDHELHKIGEEIVKKCGGLPIALKIIASTLRDNIKDAWEDALFRLQNHDTQVLYNMVQEIFEISFNNLKDDDDRAIFHLSGLFPDDFDIPIEDLLRYGWGLKLFKNVNTLPTTRRRINTCVNNLIRSNLLIQSDRVGCVKMHDLVREFVLSNFSKFKQASIVNYDNKSEWPTQDTKDSCERILLKCTRMPEFPEDFFYPNLKLLKLMNAENLYKFPDDFYKRIEKIEVVDYESMNIPLPPQIQYCTTLRTLCLRSCDKINDISFLGYLFNLEILSLADCGIRKIPSTIGKLKKLKLLDLTGCVDLCIDDGVFQNLDDLEELYMRVSDDSDTIRFTDTNCDELEKLSINLLALEVEFFQNRAQPKHVSFKKLERFRISMGRQLKLEGSEGRYDDEDSFKNTLILNTNQNELLECKINELFKKTEVLCLQVSDMNHLEDLSIDSQQSFCNLRALYVRDSKGLTYLFSIPVAKGFPKLEVLEVAGCPVLESLIHGESENNKEVIKFQELKHLKLIDLPGLVCLCNTVNVIELPQLEELKLDRLPNFTSIFPENKNNDSAMRPLLIKDVIIPKLESLDILQMKNLTQIWPCDHITASVEVNNISMLTNIRVRECDSLVNLFPINPMPLLNHLKEIYIKECNSIEELFNIDLSHYVEQVTNSSLRSIRVLDMVKLKEVWRIKGANNSHPLLIDGFHAVETISMLGCESFRSIWTPATINFRLGALIELHIHNCGTNVEKQVNVISKEEISEFDDNISSVAFTSHAIDSFHQLRFLSFITYKGVEVVFDIASQQSPLLPYLKELYLHDMEMMSHVWKCNWNKFFILQKPHPQSPFQNLTEIYMSSCNRIKYLFSPLMAKLLSNLKEVQIYFCNGVEEVVSNRDDEQMITSTSTQTNTGLFPNLDSLTLICLDNLKGIGGGTATSTAIYEGCKVTQVGAISWSLCQYSREIRIENCNVLQSVFPSYAIGEIKKLEVLKIYYCKGMMEIFETQRISNSGGTNNESQTVAKFSKLKEVDLHRLHSLKYIWKSNQRTVFEFPNLTRLSINSCHRLEHVFTSSMVGSLQKLQELDISQCDDLEVIVKEDEWDAKVKELTTLPHLKLINLWLLRSLKGFCLGNEDFSWPSLDTLEISWCPEIMIFTKGHLIVPKLTKIETRFGKLYAGEDVNSFIKTKREEESIHNVKYI